MRVALPALALSACAPVDSAADESEETANQAGDALASDNTYTKTRYPIVLCHGMAGFGSLFGGVMPYFYSIESTLTAGGAEVYITHVPQFSSSEARGEALLAQIEDIVARSGAEKVNLIAHSHGGFDSRYVAAARPDLIASITTVATPHKGAELATFLKNHLKDGSFGEDVFSLFTNSVGTLLGLLSGHTSPQDSVAAIASLSAEGTAEFNAKYPAGVPTEPCGEGAAEENGIRFYSWTGTHPITNLLDVSDLPMKLSSSIYSEPSDGMVGQCSSHFGVVIRDDYEMNHLDEVNQLFGISALNSTSPTTTYRVQANRLKNDGF
jgi:triacylglycerol lipase